MSPDVDITLGHLRGHLGADGSKVFSGTDLRILSTPGTDPFLNSA